MPHSLRSNQADPAVKPNRLRTFGGVFTPSILTILGVIVFMRAGFVIGQAGILQSLLILALANTITFLTALSISAVSTNTPVSGGGAYFLISRSLGPEFGGAIGVVLFCAQAISVPFYILGFAEALVRMIPEAGIHFMGIALATAAVLFFIAFTGAPWAIKAQYLIMAVLGISLLTMIGGAAAHFQTDLFVQNLFPGYTGTGISFWRVFAIYFPAVTGIMAGVNMSGDLKNPGYSLPVGIIASILTGFIIYMAQILLTGGAQTREQLLTLSFETFCSQALFGAGHLVMAGVVAATLSSALGSFLGAPRVLQAVARDRLIPGLGYFAHGSPRGDEPQRALCLTFGIAMGVILAAGGDVASGAFNLLAAVVTMFFLCTYGLVNLAAFVESVAGNPSFRPRFRYYHWLPALLGAMGCSATAALINPWAAFLAVIVFSAAYLMLRRFNLRARFGDARWGFIYSGIKNNLLRLAVMPQHSKNWRPGLLAVTGNPEKNNTLISYALWIGEARGLVILVRILSGDLAELGNHRHTASNQLKRYLNEKKSDAFATVIVSSSFDEGLAVLLQSQSIRPIQPNTVLLPWAAEDSSGSSLFRQLNTIHSLGMSIILCSDKGLPSSTTGRPCIDIWWRGRKNGSLMVILSHLLTLNWEWDRAVIRVFRLIQDETGFEPASASLKSLVRAGRINARTEIIVSREPFQKILGKRSQGSSLVLMGFNLPDEAGTPDFRQRYNRILRNLPTTFLVCSSGDADLLA